MLHTILVVLVFVCLILAAAGVSSRVNLFALGMAFWFLTLLV